MDATELSKGLAKTPAIFIKQSLAWRSQLIPRTIWIDNKSISIKLFWEWRGKLYQVGIKRSFSFTWSILCHELGIITLVCNRRLFLLLYVSMMSYHRFKWKKIVLKYIGHTVIGLLRMLLKRSLCDIFYYSSFFINLNSFF